MRLSSRPPGAIRHLLTVLAACVLLGALGLFAFYIFGVIGASIVGFVGVALIAAVLAYAIGQGRRGR